MRRFVVSGGGHWMQRYYSVQTNEIDSYRAAIDTVQNIIADQTHYNDGYITNRFV